MDLVVVAWAMDTCATPGILRILQNSNKLFTKCLYLATGIFWMELFVGVSIKRIFPPCSHCSFLSFRNFQTMQYFFTVEFFAFEFWKLSLRNLWKLFIRFFHITSLDDSYLNIINWIDLQLPLIGLVFR